LVRVVDQLPITPQVSCLGSWPAVFGLEDELYPRACAFYFTPPPLRYCPGKTPNRSPDLDPAFRVFKSKSAKLTCYHHGDVNMVPLSELAALRTVALTVQ
jgi:hypothetical protein